MGFPRYLALLASALVLATASAESEPPARIFSQTGVSLGPDGQSLPPVVIDPDRRDDLAELTFDLGRGRTLVLRTNLPVERRDDAADLAGVVRRCHDFLEDATGRRVEGDLLLYILTFPSVPRAYSFRVALDGPDRWSQVRLALLDDDDTLTGGAAAPHLRRLLYGTLPHELGHGLLADPPTVRHDIDGRPSHHTRWFTEGVCETLALRFARRECPTHARRLLRDRRVGRVLDSAAVRERLIHWAQADRLSWELESDLYGGAMLVVSEWLRCVPLADLLTGLAATGGGHDGAALAARLGRDTGSTWDRILDRAAANGRRLAAPDFSSR